MVTPSTEKLQQMVTEAVCRVLQEKAGVLGNVEVESGSDAKVEAGAIGSKKPEYMTHLKRDILVWKNHPRIALRGKLDSLEAEIILLQTKVKKEGIPILYQDLEEIIKTIRRLIRCEVTGEPVGNIILQGLNEEELREHSHHPSKYYGKKHFLPTAEHGEVVAELNRLRTRAREVELAAYHAFKTDNDRVEREDILRVLNRLSSLFWIMMFKYLTGRYKNEATLEGIYVEVEASGRHAHLSRRDIDALFGSGYQLTKVRDLSQPGQYVCKERISVTGPKGTIENVVVLGPERKETQVEVSFTDGLALGIKPPIRQSGDVKESVGATLSYGDRQIAIEQGVIVAKRHVHVSEEDARRWQIKDNELLDIEILSERPVIFKDTVARVSKDYATYVHIDYDEANACGFEKGMKCRILGREKLPEEGKQEEKSYLQQKESCLQKNFWVAGNERNDRLDKSFPIKEFMGKRILQEHHVMQARGQGYTGIRVDKNALITPLAMDFIKNHDMQFYRG